jgi:hypothetical protein
LYIGPEHQGQGLGEAALQALCDHGFNVLNLNSIWGEAFDGNPAIKMFERVGFKPEGRRRQFYFREGRYIDAILFSLLRDEYALDNSSGPVDQRGAGPSPTSAADVAVTQFIRDARAFFDDVCAAVKNPPKD